MIGIGKLEPDIERIDIIDERGNVMLERFLERISLSEYRSNFIIKGGFLIASMVGLDSRTTMDMDATVKGCPVSKAKIQEMIEGIIAVPVDDGISFKIKGIEATLE